MRRISKLMIVATQLAALTGENAIADDKAEYERRSIENYVQLFAWLDRDQDGAVSRSEAQGNVHFTAVFDDIDINRDGSVTKEELDRFLALRFGATGS